MAATRLVLPVPGGPWSRYPRFHALPTRGEAQQVGAALLVERRVERERVERGRVREGVRRLEAVVVQVAGPRGTVGVDPALPQLEPHPGALIDEVRDVVVVDEAPVLARELELEPALVAAMATTAAEHVVRVTVVLVLISPARPNGRVGP